MKQRDKPSAPLTPATFHILLSLTQEVAHGYHIKRLVEERTGGAVQLGAGTLYTAIRRMLNDGLIAETDAPADRGDVEPGARWRFYRITRHGRAVLKVELARLEAELVAARAIMAKHA